MKIFNSQLIIKCMLATFCAVFFSQSSFAGKSESKNVKVGDTFTVYSSSHYYTQSVLWSWDTGVLELVGSLYATSTSATFKVKKASPSVGVIIQATTYYYKSGTTSSGINKDVDTFRIYATDSGSGGGGGQSQPTSISVSPSSVSLNVGDTYTLYASLTGGTSSISWDSSDTHAVSVSSNGGTTAVIKALQPGEQRVYATTTNGLYDYCTVYVTAPAPTSIALPAIASVKEGGYTSLTATVLPSGASYSLTWSSSDTDCATVSSGRVYGKRPGKAIITAKINGYDLYSACEVTVEPNVSSVVSLTNANSDGNLNETTARFGVNITNNGTYAISHVPFTLDLYKEENSQFKYQDSKGYYLDIAVGENVGFVISYENLVAGGKYAVILSCSLDDGTTWLDLNESIAVFEVAEGATNKDCYLDFTCDFQNVVEEILNGDRLKFEATFTNVGTNDYDNLIEMQIYPVNDDGTTGNLHSFLNKQLSLNVGESKTISFESEELTNGERYVMALFYQQNADADEWVFNNQLYYFTVNLTTSISNLPKSSLYESDGELYNLQGLKVTHLNKGLYIKNGKKILIK